MTFAIGSIEGGTHAGWRKVKQKPQGWMCITCDPFIVHPGYLVKCPECGSKRP